MKVTTNGNEFLQFFIGHVFAIFHEALGHENQKGIETILKEIPGAFVVESDYIDPLFAISALHLQP